MSVEGPIAGSFMNQRKTVLLVDDSENDLFLMRTEDVDRAFDLGANSFLVKPATIEELTAMIRCLRDWLQFNHFPPLNMAVRR